MSKILCKCGELIVDQTDNLCFKSSYIKDIDSEKATKYIDDIQSFIYAIENNERKVWLENYFDSGEYNSLDNSSIINDIVLKNKMNFEKIIYQCLKCKRLYVENSNKFSIFKYEEGEENIFE